MFIVTTTAETASASKNLQQLCKYFAHKVHAKWDVFTGDVKLPFGDCRMEASPNTLNILCEADEEQKINRMKPVIDDHLERFAWKEKLKLTWCAADTPGRD